MASLVGGAFLSASLQVLFDRLASREVVNFFSKQTSSVPDLLKKLKRKLLLLNAVLDDADVKQFTDKTVKAWLDEARDAVYEADDLLEEIAYEALRCKVESDPRYHCSTSQVEAEHDESQSGTSKVKSSASSYASSFDEAIEPKLEKIIDLLEDLIEDAGVLGLKKGVRNDNTSNRSSSSVVVESDIYGRDSEKEELIKFLLSDETSSTNNEIGVIPVVGMGGMGKTTLAQLAYNDDRVNEHFQTMKAWVCVSQDFDVLRVSKTILESITKYPCRSTDLNQVQESLKENLKWRKFLVVLDDVWNENYGMWDSFRTPFRTGAPGSKIIVTTRIQAVASIMKTDTVINLTELRDDHCWSLFSKIAFDGSDPSCYLLLEGIGKKIVKRCRGLPLATKSLAGLLRSKTPEEWDAVLKSEFWDIPEDKCDILPALRLSYHYLPSHLKQCFALCSLFPKNYAFREEEIVPMWIAHKYVLPKGGQNYEMEGKKCFRELLSMSFQKCARWKSYFVMHDLIHGLAEVVCGQFSFRLDDEDAHEVPVKARHFTFHVEQVNDLRQLRVAKEVTSLRTFRPIPFGEWTWQSKDRLDDVLSRQKHMRMLSLLDYIGNSELFDRIGSLIHLHYLDLSWTSIQHLPESICKLHNLQTLLLSYCRGLTTLPVEIGKLLSLVRLDLRQTNLMGMPQQMSLLKGLEYLTTFVVGNSGGVLGIEGLKAWPILRGTLEISGLENVRPSKAALEAKMKEKQHLEMLHLQWGWDLHNVSDDSQFEREVLDNLRPHTNLKYLTVNGYRGTRFPDWLGSDLFTKMVYLHLDHCNSCYELPALGQLPCLKELRVEGMGRVIEVGQEFYGSCAGINRPFPSLEVLYFGGMWEWVEWCIPGIGEFPKLRRLEIYMCPKLVGGLPRDIACIVITNCSSLEASVPTLSTSSSFTATTDDDADDDIFSDYLKLKGSEGVEINWQAVTYGLLVRLEISDLPSLNVLTSELCVLTKLRELVVDKCPKLVSLSNTGLPPMLERLHITECECLQSVIDGMVSHNTCCSFRDLSIRSCPSLVSFADNGLPPSLREVHFHDCPKLEFPISEDFESCCPLVENLNLSSCLSLNPMACFLQRGLANLTSITLLNCRNLKSLPDGISNLLPLLERMNLEDCQKLESFGEGGLPSSLGQLLILRCQELVSFRSEWGLQKLPSLETLTIGGVDESVESFPEEGLLPSTLTLLRMAGFPNMKKLDWMGIRRLTSLQSLYIVGCPKLESLPEEGLPPSIQVLDIRLCPLLEPRCKKDMGQDWSKIAHIPTFLVY